MFEFLAYAFGVRALIGGAIVAVTCASLGVFLVLRRLSLIADGLGHVAFGGIAFGFFAGIYPLYAAVGAVLAGSFGIHALRKVRVFSDAAIGMMSACGLALGVVLISLTQSVPADLLSYLFGTILGLANSDIYLAAGLGFAVLLTLMLLWKEWVAITLDPDFSKVAGMPVERLEVLFVVLTGLTVVVATKLVGVLLVSSLMIIPASAAIQLKMPFRRTVMVACAIALASVLTGLQLSFSYNLSPGGAIVLVSIACFLAATATMQLVPRIRPAAAIGQWSHRD